MVNRQESRPYYRIAHNPSADLGLGRNARGHLVKTGGGFFGGPLVKEFIDIHGEEAKREKRRITAEGGEARNLGENEGFTVLNPHDETPTGIKPAFFFRHIHPQPRVNDLVAMGTRLEI